MTFAPPPPAPMPDARPYTNPVWDGDFGDPFVLSHANGYVAFGTGPVENGRAIPTLLSEDLVTWRRGENAIALPEATSATEVWAPEAIEFEGRFYLYYSVGSGHIGHGVQVAVGDRPEGPYEHFGGLTDASLPFAIDGHAFWDRPENGGDGSLWFFYAADRLDGARPGTCLFVDRMLSPTELAGEERCILRADADWQIYARNRKVYGDVYDWHTLEGPTVVRRDGRLTMLFSGGNFGNETYGVDFAVADHPAGPWHHDPVELPRVLRTDPGRVVGPGHNSLVSLPDSVVPGGRDLIVYHAWDVDQTARTMRIDPLRWTDDGPRVDGPTTEIADLLR